MKDIIADRIRKEKNNTFLIQQSNDSLGIKSANNA